MGVNIVKYGNQTLIDLTDTTAVASDVAQGKYFYGKDGVKTLGTATGGGGYTITNNLTNVTTNNATTEVVANQPYYAVLTIDTGYSFENCTVTMGNTDITSTAFDSSNMNITISSVTGNVEIIASASKAAQNYAVEYQGNFSSSTPSTARVTLITDYITLLYGETITLTVQNGFKVFMLQEYGNKDPSKNRTPKQSNQLYVYGENVGSGYVYTSSDVIVGWNNQSPKIQLSGNAWLWVTTPITATITNSSISGIEFGGLGFLVAKTDDSAITISEAKMAVSLDIPQTTTEELLNIMMGEA